MKVLLHSLAKEIRLKHHAPVISICVIDRNAVPLPASFEVQHERAKSPDMSGNHSVIICSEEQLKVCFSSLCILTSDYFAYSDISSSYLLIIRCCWKSVFIIYLLFLKT